MAAGVVGETPSPPCNDGGEFPDALDMALDGGVNAGTTVVDGAGVAAIML